MSDKPWSLNLALVFENYGNVREWCNKIALLGFIIGDLGTKRIANILFNSPTDFNSACDLARFIESSSSSEVSFVGILSLTDAEYAFDVRKLSIMSLDAELFLYLSTDTATLQNGDIEQFIENNDGILLVREQGDSADLGRGGLLARVCERISLDICVDDPRKISKEVSKAFALEAEAVDALCFMNADKNLIIMDESESQLVDISPLFEDISKSHFSKDHIEFIPLRTICNNLNGDIGPRLVPIVKIKNGPVTYYNMKTCIYGYTLLTANDSSEVLLERLRVSLRRALFLLENCVASSNFIAQDFTGFHSYAFLYGNNIISVFYPRSNDETLLRGYRTKLHKVFNLSFERPLLRPSQAISFNSPSRFLRDPHLYITNYKPKGELSLVKGHYDYHHYMQDGLDDTGWGCAYRSLQSIWSWLILQGYTDKPVPTHRQIQESLYECGDKDAKFVGSRQWIGSMELGYCLDNMLNIQSRIINTNSGAEVADNVRQLAQHFKSSGAPVMIGGGMLAHTILGVDFNDSTGECAFLVLDPHYTGEENLSVVLSKGWCGWKPPTFWKQEDFYNMLLPLPPINVI